MGAFYGVKVSYKEEVLSVVTKIASTHKEEVLKLGEGNLPYIRTVLARQRRDYGIDEERFPAQSSPRQLRSQYRPDSSAQSGC